MSALKRDRARSYLAATRRTDSPGEEALDVLKHVTFDALLSSPNLRKHQQVYDGDCESCRRYKQEIAECLQKCSTILSYTTVVRCSETNNLYSLTRLCRAICQKQLKDCNERLLFAQKTKTEILLTNRSLRAELDEYKQNSQFVREELRLSFALRTLAGIIAVTRLC
eukprot:767133-Hanusia_phi.AAC.5